MASEAELDDVIADEQEEIEELVKRLWIVNNLLEALEMTPQLLEGGEDTVEQAEERIALLADSADAAVNEDTPDLARAVGDNTAEFQRAAVTLAAMERAGLLDDVESASEEIQDLMTRLELLNNLFEAVELFPEAMEGGEAIFTILEERAALAAESADALLSEETVELAEAVGDNTAEFRRAALALAVIERTGMIDDAARASEDISDLDGELSDLLTDTARLGLQLQDQIGNEDLGDLLETALSSVNSVYEESPPKRVGTFGLLRAMRNRDVQHGLGFVISVLEELGKELRQKK